MTRGRGGRGGRGGGRGSRWAPCTLLALAGTLAGGRAATARAQVLPPPMLDSIVVVTHDVFDSTEASGNFLFKLANAVRFRTRPEVVRRELLFRRGESFDSARVAETLRNLRRRGLFRSVGIDTVRRNGRLIAQVETRDGWSTNLELNGRSTGGVFTWSTSLSEQNFLGTGDFASLGYRHEVDRNALTVESSFRRIGGTRLLAQGFYDDLSDGHRGGGLFGVPFRAFSDRGSFDITGETARQRILQFRDGALLETYRRRLLRAGGGVALAARADPGGYLRLGVVGQVKREEYVRFADTLLAIPDTVTGAVGLFGEWAQARFKVVTHYNGFAREEDIDLSARVSLRAWLAPEAFGYPRTGFGPALSAQAGVDLGRVFLKMEGRASGLYTSAGLDSGQVWTAFTIASQLIRRQATVLRLEGGAQRAPPPGQEFDLGHGTGPRAFGPHAFTGTRTVWGMLEHRAFLIDQFLGVLGVGFAGFFDYGGAWYAGQRARWGGDVGLGLRVGATRSTGVNLGRLDLAYRFGDGFNGSRWVFSFGRSYAF